MEIGAENSLVAAMQQPFFYDHPVGRVELIETHASWVFLAGAFAYKVKKPVNFGFLDFSTLANRHHFCLEELRLNRRFAPQLYLDVKTIGGDPSSPEMGGRPALEYAVKMRRFEQKDQLDRVLADNRLNSDQVACFATLIARVHQGAAVAGAEQFFGTPESVIEPVLENFRQIHSLLPAAELGLLTELEHWSRRSCQDLAPFLLQRKNDGFVRECHGDLHLANMAWIDAEPILFDCIEFNDNLRWIDVINDIAFLVMDLDDRGRADLGWHLLNRYLQETGDYQGLKLLRFYAMYRAMVRAKVICLRLAQPGASDVERKQDRELYQGYLALASGYISPPSGALIITHGVSGSGKSTFAREFAACCGAIHLLSDLERKRLHRLAATANSHSPPGGGIYSAAANKATYAQLQRLAETALTAGYPVVVDATFLRKKQRDPLRRLASKFKVPIVILDFDVPEAELRRRIHKRAAEGPSLSEANIAVLNAQLGERQPLDASEKAFAVTVGSETSPDDVAANLFTVGCAR